MSTRKPAIPTKVTLAGLCGVILTAGTAAATGVAIVGPAEVTEPAVRIQPYEAPPVFPAETEPYCALVNGFGEHSKYLGAGNHQGLDIGGSVGQEIYAVEDGVLYDEWNDTGAAGLGWGLLSDTDVKYRYFHLDEKAPGLEVGDRVSVGQLIGTMGVTGNAGGPHLHFEVRPGPDYDPIDPYPVLAPMPEECHDYVGPPSTTAPPATAPPDTTVPASTVPDGTVAPSTTDPSTEE